MINISDLKESRFTLVITDFYAWLRDIESKPYVKNFNYSINDMAETGPGRFTSLSEPPNAGKILAVGDIEFNEEI